jgi:TonB family protein
MTSFLLYQLKAGMCIMLFTGLYYALFRKETFHRFNRFYLISSLLLSAILPAIRLPGIAVGGTPMLPNFILAVTVYADKAAFISPHETHPFSLLERGYLLITLFFTACLFYQLVNLIILISRRGITPMGNYRLVILPEKNQSFSFFNLVFMSSSAAQTDQSNQILQHEMAHAQQWHSLDIMIIQLVKIFQWFNPFIYLTEKSLQETHEYLADEAVLEQDGQSDRYRLLLLTRVFGVQPGILSFFNYSLIKNRLTMMTKEKSPLRNRLKYLAVMPLILFIGLLICCKQHKTENVPPPPPPPPPPAEITKSAETVNMSTDGEPTYDLVDIQAKFQGGNIETFRDWVQKNLVYPPEAIKNGVSGKVMVQFAVNSKGKVCDVKILRGADPLLDKETIRVIQLSPDWKPAQKDGKNVKQQFVMPTVYALQ